MIDTKESLIKIQAGMYSTQDYKYVIWKRTDLWEVWNTDEAYHLKGMIKDLFETLREAHAWLKEHLDDQSNQGV